MSEGSEIVHTGQTTELVDKPAAANFLQQQARFDKFIEVFNNERPHEALGMKCPADVYPGALRVADIRE